MKKLAAAALTMAMCLCISACGEPGSSDDQTEADDYSVTYIKAQLEDTESYTKVNLIAEVENTSDNTVQMETASFDLTGDDGTVISTLADVQPMPNIVEPGEKAYYCMSASVDMDEEATGDLTAVPHITVNSVTQERVNFAVSEGEISEDDSGNVSVLVKVDNSTKESYEYAYVAAVLFNKKGEPIDVMVAYLTGLMEDGYSSNISLRSYTYDGREHENAIRADDVDSVETFAYPEQG